MEAISKGRQAQILQLLSDIEVEHNITIFHAVESGSRAWGFPSLDSDYDIRFIYHHPQAWYITAFEKKDHIDIAIEDALDAGGWELGKCMRLMYKGNAVLQEWLNSPVVYRSDPEKHQQLRRLAADIFNPVAAFYHYCSQVKKRLADDKTRVNSKAFLYGFRSLLCAKWIVDESTAPPVLFQDLVQKYAGPGEIKDLNYVLDRKAGGAEKDKGPIPESLWRYVELTYKHLENEEISAPKTANIEKFDSVLRTIVAQP